MSEPADPVLLEGREAWAARALEVARCAERELDLLTQNLDSRIYGTEAFVDAISAFVRQHSRTRFRILVADTRQAIAGGSRLIELGRRLSSFIEFRELGEERRQVIREEYLLGDGRMLLYRENPGDLESRYYSDSPLEARDKLKSFDLLWNESTTAQELRDLKM